MAGLFDKASHPEKPKSLLEREKDQERRIRAALHGLRGTYLSKSPTNMMLQKNRSISPSSAPIINNIGTLMSASPNSGAFGDLSASNIGGRP